MNKLYFIYDDSNPKSEIITDVIGTRGFGDVVIKRKKIEQYYKETINSAIFENTEWISFHSIFDLHDIQDRFTCFMDEDIRIIHAFSNFFISNIQKTLLSLRKIEFIEKPYRVIAGNKTAYLMFESVRSYISFIDSCQNLKSSYLASKDIESKFEVEGLIDIGITSNFIQCITGNFDSRYFNSLNGNEYTLVKTSSNKKKIRAEYTFYHLLPDDMKMWFVMPFNYKETESVASYTMERFHITDLSIKWVHGSISVEEFSDILDKYFYFFNSRKEKTITVEEYKNISCELYVSKVKNRIEILKTLKEFSKINKLLLAADISIDSLLAKYLTLKEKVEKNVKFDAKSVIGHGDPCFANVLYNKMTQTLKFIDPKGAIEEKDLWTNPYYDIAKLSHSVCGLYDFFNNALFEIFIDEEFKFNLNIDFDNSKYIELFKRKLEENGFDYLAVRLYEASLFLSMLPLHIDYPHKVFGFILNAKNILQEIENAI